MSRVLSVLPARLASERLPRKPLQLLAGRPLIQHVWEKAAHFTAVDSVVIATESTEVANVCRDFGAVVEMTGSHHTSGTSRVAEVAARREYESFDIVVNIQGDEPFVAEEHVTESVRMVRAGFEIGTIGTPILTLDAWRDPAAVKIALGASGRALYFSRSPIPHRRGGEPTSADLESADYLRHIGVYAFTRDALAKWAALPETRLENLEKLEQLRPLAAGMTIGVAIVRELSVGIDTPEDLELAEQHLRSAH